MTKDEANKAADALLKKMEGKGWKKVVLEDMGWHYSVTNKTLSVCGTSTGKYFAMVGDSSRVSLTCWANISKTVRRDPNKAAQQAIHMARTRLNKCLKLVENAEAIYREPDVIPPEGSAACPICGNIWLDSDEAATCCEDKRRKED
jgi:hypothetical protein